MCRSAHIRLTASRTKGLQVSTVRIGTRGSPLALAQAHQVRALLMAAHGLPEERFSIRIIKTAGDQILDRPLSELGGKGLFTKEIEDALSSRAIDLAVHSAKDMSTKLPDGLAIGAVLEREDVRDAFISLKYASLAEMPSGAVVGTSSLRRQAQVKRARPDLQVVGFRGNVQTRLAKLEAGVADATFLATAGLKRLGQAERITRVVPVYEMLPAVAQAAIAVEIRADDAVTRDLVATLDHRPTAICLTAERAFLRRLDGSCRTPIAGLATIDAGELRFTGELLLPDGSDSHASSGSGPLTQAALCGDACAERLIEMAGPDFMRRLVS
jgi:hydroxymethylbilane synthase